MFARMALLAIGLSAAPLAAQSNPAPVWQPQPSGTTASLRGIHAVNDMVAWASGSQGTILRTIDGGQHWSRCATPDGDTDGATLDFRGIQAWDEKAAIVMASGPGDKSRVYKTTDGCGTWKLIFKNPDAPQGFFDCLAVDSKILLDGKLSGYLLLLGDPVDGRFRLFEGGSNLDTLKGINSTDLLVPDKKSSAFAASNSCLSAQSLKDSFAFITGGGSNSYLQRVRYGHGTWQELPDDDHTLDLSTRLPLASGEDGSGAFSIARHVRSTGAHRPGIIVNIVVGGDYTKPNDPTGSAAYSFDSGQTWLPSTTPPHGYRSSVQWSEALRLWITVGTNGSDLSRDDGRTWQPVDNGNWNALSLPYVVGPQGRIARLNPAALPEAN